MHLRKDHPVQAVDRFNRAHDKTYDIFRLKEIAPCFNRSDHHTRQDMKRNSILLRRYVQAEWERTKPFPQLSNNWSPWYDINVASSRYQSPGYARIAVGSEREELLSQIQPVGYGSVGHGRSMGNWLRTGRWMAWCDMVAWVSLLPLLFWGMAGWAAHPTSFVEIGTPLPITSDTYPNNEPRAVYNSRHHEYLALWTTRHGAATRDIWARRVGRDGQMGDVFQLASYPGRYCYQLRAIYNPIWDEYAVAYTCWHGLTSYDVFVTRVRWDGAMWNAYDTITVAATERSETHPAITYNEHADAYLVVWTEDIRFDARLWMRRLSAADGKWLDEAIEISGASGEQRAMADVAYNPMRDRYLLVYLFEADGPADVRYRTMPGDLSNLGTEKRLWEHSASLHALTPVVASGTDEYLVAWPVRHVQAPPPSTERMDLYWQKLDGGGSVIGPPDERLSTDPPFDEHYDPDIAYSHGYGYLVTTCYAISNRWEADVYGYHVLEGQDALRGLEFAIDDRSGKQMEPAVACAPDGECLVVETYYAIPRSDSDIVGRLVHPGWLAFLQR